MPRSSALTTPARSQLRCDIEALPEPGTGVVVRVRGEIDVVTIAELLAGITRAAESAPRTLVVDIAAVSYSSVNGVAILAAAGAAAADAGIRYGIAGATPLVERLLAVCEMHLSVPAYTSVEHAVTALDRPTDDPDQLAVADPPASDNG